MLSPFRSAMRNAIRTLLSWEKTEEYVISVGGSVICPPATTSQAFWVKSILTSIISCNGILGNSLVVRTILCCHLSWTHTLYLPQLDCCPCPIVDYTYTGAHSGWHPLSLCIFEKPSPHFTRGGHSQPPSWACLLKQVWPSWCFHEGNMPFPRHGPHAELEVWWYYHSNNTIASYT